MQLTIEVLPAPLGPMIENSSPSFTPKLTSVSARTPPKRSDTPRTSKALSTHSSHAAFLDKAEAGLPPENALELIRAFFTLWAFRGPDPRAEPTLAAPVTIFN